AAAESLEDQSRSLVRSVAMFRLQSGGAAPAMVPVVPDNVARLPERTSRPAAPRAAAPLPKVRRAGGGSGVDVDDEWEEF
ncbi:hypothetical protein, partial [Zoogloea oleivorans]|uniref:hypothetical protein n=1 Tax=Zoogloea oleivorans TaxID=1552750 RepID=UPI003CCC4988